MKGFVDHADLIQKDKPLQLRRNNMSRLIQPETYPPCLQAKPTIANRISPCRKPASVSSDVQQIVSGQSHFSAAGSTRNALWPENSYDISGTNLESERQVGVPLLENLQMLSKPFKNPSPVPTYDIHWETCPTKKMRSLVAHQSVDEPRDLTLKNVASSAPQIFDGRSSSSAAGTTSGCSNPRFKDQYLLPGIDHDGEQMYFILTNHDLRYSPNDYQKATTAEADVACWETCPTKEMSSLVAHQSVDEPRDLILENETQQESSRPCSKLSTSVEDDVCQEKLLTAKTAILSMD
jgi:hypothetical protein